MRAFYDLLTFVFMVFTSRYLENGYLCITKTYGWLVFYQESAARLYPIKVNEKSCLKI